MKAWLKRAFAIEKASDFQPSAEEAQVIDRLVHEIVRRRLTAPALLFLEASNPLNFVASQFLLFVGPLAELLFPKKQLATFTASLERRGCTEYICRRIEAMAGGVVVAGSGENSTTKESTT